MRALFLRIIVATATLAASAASPHVSFAQMHKVAKPQQVVRAVGVYEWTGDFAKPTASRLIPVSLYIEGKFEDAGIYTARPIPFALVNGNVYLLQSAGIDKGTLDLAYAKHLQAIESTGDLAFDDGWFGYGSVKPLSAPRKTAALKPSKTLPVLTTTADPNRPHFGSKPASDTASSGTTSSGSDQSQPAATKTDDKTNDDKTNNKTDTTASSTTSPSSSTDPDRPTMKRRTPDSTPTGTDTTTTSTTQTGSTPADDPDRPTMKRRSPDTTPSGSDPTTTASTTDNAPAPSNDPDRPTLKRHAAEDEKKANIATVTATGSLNDDPNRPNLHRGKSTRSMTEADLPRLAGLPPTLHQMVAVSDAAKREQPQPPRQRKQPPPQPPAPIAPPPPRRRPLYWMKI
jgi:hypothetical protein